MTRRDFGIRTGDKLLVFGDLEQGLGIATFAIMQRTMQGATDLFREVGSTMRPKDDGKAGKRNR
jgi:hypothetical protein